MPVHGATVAGGDRGEVIVDPARSSAMAPPARLWLTSGADRCDRAARELACGPLALVGILRDCAIERLLKAARQVGPDRPELRRGSCTCAHSLSRSLSRSNTTPKHLEQHAAERVDICPGVDLTPPAPARARCTPCRAGRRSALQSLRQLASQGRSATHAPRGTGFRSACSQA
jgi:hypothetical protein